MLSISKMSSGQGNYYAELAREDYYLEGGEPLGAWWGRGASKLGLLGPVDREQLTNLFEGLRPDGERGLVQLQHFADGRTRQPGWDLTFSAPKSVSVIWSQADSELRAAIQDAHFNAVREALEYLEQEASFSRRGHGGAELSRAGLIVGLFEHGTSRAQDPQLHTHALVMNAAMRLDDGSFGTLRSRDLYIHKMAAGVLYRTALAGGLRALGFSLERTDKAFEVEGVPKPLIERFSTRRAEIEAAMVEAGATGARAAEAFTLSTRKVKEHVARETLFEAWRKEGGALGFDLRGIDRASPATESVAELVRNLRLFTGRSITSLLEHQSYFTAREVLRAVLEQVQHRGVDTELVRHVVQASLRDDERMLELPADGPHARYTTRAMYALEESLFQTAGRLRASCAHEVPRDIVEGALAGRPYLNDEQREVVRAVTHRGGDIQLVEGMAGTGKTTVLKTAREAWVKAGLKPIGCSLAAKAKSELSRAAGIESFTIAKLLLELEKPTSGVVLHHGKQLVRTARGKRTSRQDQPPVRLTKHSVLVVDEAGMVGTRMLEKLLGHAERAGARVVLVGDSRQLQPIEAGGPFRALAERFGATKLTHIVRQEQEWMRAAVHEFAEGDSRAALARYVEHGRLAVGKTREEAMELLVRQWAAERTADLSESLLLAGTRKEAARLNALAQQARLKNGELSEEVGCALGTQRLLLGDKVLLTQNNTRLGVYNGDFGRIIRVARNGTISVELERQDNGAPVLAQFNLETYPHIQLGYAATTHKGQGSTLRNLYALAGGAMQDRELTYVQMSRHQENAFVAVNASDLEEDLAELTRSMSVSHQKYLAHDLQTPAPYDRTDIPLAR